MILRKKYDSINLHVQKIAHTNTSTNTQCNIDTNPITYTVAPPLDYSNPAMYRVHIYDDSKLIAFVRSTRYTKIKQGI